MIFLERKQQKLLPGLTASFIDIFKPSVETAGADS